jgi:two-component system, OmpR family, sensor histidine kinase TctE
MPHWRPASLRSQLLWGILLPLVLLFGLNTASLYKQTLGAANTAYDRTLLASAKSIGEQLSVARDAQGELRVQAALPYAALEAFEADTRSRMYYKVSGFQGELVSGFSDLATWQGRLPERNVYAALVHFYDSRYQDQAVRVAVLLQPVAGAEGQGMATVQVAETLELRQTLARQLLEHTVWRQVLMLALVAAVVVWAVQRATRPLRSLSTQLLARHEQDLRPVTAAHRPADVQPMVDAINAVLQRLASVIDHQKRFVRDASHQLRTPLAVLKAQVQSAQRGDIAPERALADIAHTAERATELANQMLALAKIEQLQQSPGNDAPLERWDEIVRAVALELAPLMAERRIDFDIVTEPAHVRSHAWALSELSRNLMHNAIAHNPAGSKLFVQLKHDSAAAVLTVIDSGPGIEPAQAERLFQPFARGNTSHSGSGLGLAICQGIVASLGGSIELNNRMKGDRIEGLDAVVRLPVASHEHEKQAHEKGLPREALDSSAGWAHCDKPKV